MTDDALPLLLDVDRMRAHIERIPLLASGQARLGSASLERLWIKPGRHLHAAYRVDLTTERGPVKTRVAVGALRDTPPPAVVLRRALAATAATGSSGMLAANVAECSALVGDPPLLVQLFPWDFRLPTLPLAVHRGCASAALGAEITDIETVGYWPGMRCQLRYRLSEGTERYGKVFPDASGAGVAETMRRITAAADRIGGLRTPRVATYLPSLQCLVTEPVAGIALYDRLLEPGLPEWLDATARALAALHGLAVDGIERVFGTADDLAVVRPWTTLVSRTFPDLARPLATAVAALEGSVPPAGDAPIGLVHRDFYDKQILIDDSRVALLDLDTACRGHAEIDVANFLAHLVLRGLQWERNAARFAAAAARFLEGYRRARPTLSLALLRWYRAATLLRLACVYAVRPAWHHLAPSLIEEGLRDGA